jgi:hypothetical protein
MTNKGKKYFKVNKVEDLKKTIKIHNDKNCKKATNITKAQMISYLNKLGYIITDAKYNDLKKALYNYKFEKCYPYSKLNKEQLLKLIKKLGIKKTK